MLHTAKGYDRIRRYQQIGLLKLIALHIFLDLSNPLDSI